MSAIHPSAVIDPAAQIHDSAHIGPYCVIDGPVRIGEGVRLIGHNWLRGPMEVGAGCTLYPFASAGLPPQHTGINPDDDHPGVRLGERVTLREHVTIHCAMPGKPVPTTIGDGCYLMSSAHVGHDCQIAENVVIASNSPLAGHVTVEKNAFISGNVCIHQYCRVGRNVMVSGGSVVSMDVPPYTILSERNRLGGLNLVGMRRAGIPSKEISYARQAFRAAFRASVPKNEMLEILDAMSSESTVVAEMAAFVRLSTRGIAPGDGRPSPGAIRWMRDLVAGKADIAAAEVD